MNSIINVNADLIRKVRVFVTYLWTRARFGLLALMYDLQILPAHIKETDNYLLSHTLSVIDGVEVYF